MSLLPTTACALAVIVGAMGVIALFELAIPLHARSPAHRRHLRPNLVLTFITFATNAGLNSALVVVLDRLERSDFGVLRWASLDPLLSRLIAIAVLDLSFYVAHVAMHQIAAFWKVHRIHHADPVVDVTTTIRQHPLEGLIRYAFAGAFACLAGVGAGTFVVYRTCSAINGLLEHANIRIPRSIDAALSLVTTWPNTHKVHHSRDVGESNTNYGNLFSWFDRLFGTHTPSRRGESVRCGLDGFEDPSAQTTIALLAMPFRDHVTNRPE